RAGRLMRKPTDSRAMDETERLSSLIGDIYDAALDPERWVGVLEQTCNFIVGTAAALQSHHLLQQAANFYFSWNDNPNYTKSYIEKYAKLNPVIVPVIIQARVGEISACLDFITPEQYRRTQLWKEWAGPQGYIDAVQVVLDKSATSYAGVAVMRHERH